MSISELKSDLESVFNIPTENQKLIFKSQLKNDASLADSHIDNASKVILMGSSQSDVDSVTAQSERLKKVQVMRSRNRSSKSSSTRGSSSSRAIHTTDQYSFGGIEVLSEFPDKERARQYLQKLKDDVGVKGVMAKYKWSVGILKELHPIRDPTILGYNQNKGMSIALRLRTDLLDGFRAYDMVKKVLMHELTHMVHS